MRSRGNSKTPDRTSQHRGLARHRTPLDLVTTHDSDGRVVSISEGFSDVFGFRAVSVVGTYPPFPWWVPEDHHWLGHLFTVAIKDESGDTMNIAVPMELQTVQGELSHWITHAERLDDGRTAFHTEAATGARRDVSNAVLNMAVELGELAKTITSGDPAELATVSDAELRLGLLSRREEEVLKLLLRGRRVQQIGQALHISAHTARNHRRSIFQKLGVKSQVDLLVELRH